MKKIIPTLLVVTILMLVASGYATSQISDKGIAFIPAKNQAAYVAFINRYGNEYEGAALTANDSIDNTATTSKATLKAIKANNRALKEFKKSYKKDLPDATWNIREDAIIASFSKDSVRTMVVYNKKGKWFHTVTYYPEHKTPEEIASVIDYSYPRDEIKLTVKVEEGSMLFYIVQLEGKKTFKKVTVYNDEVNVIEELTKSN